MAKINSFTQSEDGYLWLGTDGAALVRFDGEKFKEIDFKNEQNNFHFNDLVSRGDNIYAATAYYGFRKYSRKDHTFIRIDDIAIIKGEGDRIIVQGSTIYFVGSKGIAMLKNGKEKLVKKFAKPLENRVDQVIETPNGVFITCEQGVFRFTEEKFTELKNEPELESIANLSSYRFGWFQSDQLSLYDRTFTNKIIIKFTKSGGISSIKHRARNVLFSKNEYAIATDFNPKLDQRVVLTNVGSIFIEKADSFEQITHNYIEPFQVPEDIMIGNNGEFWVSSGFTGLFKISIEPFTKVQLSQLFMSPDIGFPLVHNNSEIALSLMTSGTYVGKIEENARMELFDIRVYASSEIKGTTFLATSDGIKKYQPNNPNPFERFLEDGQSISFIHEDGFDLWYSVRGEGLSRYNIVTKKKTTYGSNKLLPLHFYTAQTTFNGDEVIFGTSDGIYKYSKKTKKFNEIDASDLGSYSGVSAIDAFGNLWFTLERGLVGIVNGKVVQINNNRFSPSAVLYTLNADKYGNLILGTNKGIIILKVNAAAKMTSYQIYSGGSGFDGYETHMRSQHQIGNRIYLGTIEGLFIVNTDILENLSAPLKPIITDVSDPEILESRIYHLHVNNPKIPTLYYRYRIKELGKKWIDLKKSKSIKLHDLSSGDYTLEVCSSHDGIIFSEPSIQTFTVELPIWNSKLFIVWFILIVLMLNLIVLVYGKRYDSTRLLSTKDTELHIQMAPTTLLFGTIITTSSQLIGSYLDSSLDMHLGSILLLGFVLLTLYIISMSAKKNGLQHIYKYLLAIGVYVITAHLFYELYRTHLNPFYLIGIVLTISIAPFLLSRMINTVAFGIVVFLISVLCFIFIEDPLYSKVHFMIAILASIGLLIVNTYLRYNSLEKLMFISGIINRGNFPVVAYRGDGTITYVSENISQYADITHDTLINNKISFLNAFVPYGDEYKSHDATVEFVEGKKYLIPMIDADQTVRWMEWSYKRFSENTRVIIGQDVSERIELQNTYEMLVQNVEDLIFTVDINGNFVFVNDTFISRTGFSKEELIGTDSLNVVDPEYRNEVDLFYRTHFKERKSSSYHELPIRSKSREIIWIGQYVNTIYVPGTKNHIKGFIALARDITAVREQQKLITSQRDDITASINYAQRIQFNLLPSERLFDEHFVDHFILYSPKDIVSGDFYWTQKIDDKLVLVLGDCTGHGVPGAFMTLLGINLLNNIVLEARLTEPGMILNELDKRLEEYFGSNTEEKLADGMELTVCVIDDSREEISYACAGSRFLIHEENGFTLHKGNNEHVGDVKTEEFTGYITQYTPLTSKDTLYLFSDGFQDQFGGLNNKKYSFRRMLELLEANINLSLKDQQLMIKAEFDQWRTHQPQTDDVTVIGIKREQKTKRS